MTGSVARRYAKALFALAQEENTLESTMIELQQLAALASDPELAHALANPLLSQRARKAIARTLTDRLALRPTTRNFIFVLAEQKRLDQIPRIADHYRRLVDQSLNRARVQITSAQPLSETQLNSIIACFERLTDKNVIAATRVDPSLLGGVIIEVEGKVFDASVQTQLERLARRITAGRVADII